ncbi:ABC transporter substrate-binding protein [Palleronia caenipelagi]|uniref:Extracellular solute-binding protein n=1 Tax=Palleronia caenipelagi TaxID=2489174 RepID=A0A547PLY4_9RHOB|nr:extracellular solute-binding protein [Palleronia caenipelagi]TRD15034.1 extracellular solute-binding protein [Palleronia caenipelagi]
MSIKKRILLGTSAASLMASIGFGALAEDKPFDGETVKWLIPSGHNAYIMKVHQDEVKEKLGITLEGTEINENQIFETAMSDWVTGSVDYCLVTLLAPWNGDFMDGGFLRPLDDLIAGSETGGAAASDIIEQFGVLATQWNGTPYAFGQDGDITGLYFRKDILGNEEIMAGFKEAKGYDLPNPPQTVPQLVDIAEYLNGMDWDGDGDVEYGYAQTWHVPWRTFLPFYGSATGGDVLFDAEMNPKINRPEVAEMLNDMRRLVQAGPPGASSYGYVEGPASFINGDVPATWFWGDVAKLIYTPGWAGDPQFVGEHWKGQIGYGLLPGYEVDGETYNYSELGGKIVGITEACENPEAAFAALSFLSDPSRSYKTVDSTATGSDPFGTSQLNRPAEEWDVVIDQEYLDLIPELMSNGYPAPPIPGGQEYLEAIDRHISGFLVDENASAEDTLAAITDDWQQITDSRDRDAQIKVWGAYLNQLGSMGFKVSQ